MNHPDDLLAGYVDGSLPHDERAGVDAHLAACPRCRDQVSLARAAHRALATLPNEELPQEVRAAILLETQAGSAGSGPPAWHRWAGVAAAAAVVTLIAVTLPSLGRGTDSRTTAAEASNVDAAATEGGAGLRPSDELTLQVSNRRLTLESVQGMALAFRSSATAVGSVATPDYGSSESPTAVVAADALLARAHPEPEGTEAALDCLHRAFGELFTTAPVQLIEATYDGERVYLAVTLAGSGGGQPDDTVFVLVAAKDDCSIVTSTQASLDP